MIHIVKNKLHFTGQVDKKMPGIKGDVKDQWTEAIKTTFHGQKSAKSRSYLGNFVLQTLGF